MTEAASPAPSPPGADRPLAEAKTLADSLPGLLVEARRIATTVLAGWHGRRRAGPGETFWQFRPFLAGEAPGRIDWRRSARDDHLYVREREWEAAHTIWLAADLSRSMEFRSPLATASKRDRAVVLLLAVAELLAGAGERIGLIGLSDPVLARNAAERLAETLLHRGRDSVGLPDTRRLTRFADLVMIGDLLDPLGEIDAKLADCARAGATVHLIEIRDPVEETFPYAGRAEFRDPESGTVYVAGRAEQIADDYRRHLAARRDHLASTCRRLGWSYLVHRTDRPATEPLLALHARLSDRSLAGGAI
ncbi:DUF58 domain-containing protein [Kaistia geumhonensis]|uniref:Uncharacterized protein (DUF58 family) n=1 Tax=Kaistia geumhonensis TaxID=410839 RepID=A0ABU0MB42_9HYPH|nr:DUF58 domain-containing protein [Kaistia geumhonensis]MCX5481138.1 DUF58 domain-containing protein [Kaistia geumhonensis]MDQ0518198.1 uncharacterized protein (DUF58 family) [Kaistia geumhonensis]